MWLRKQLRGMMSGMNPLDALTRARSHFELFSMPVRFTLDRPSFERKYLELMHLTHPDLAGEDTESQMRAMELSSRVNEAYTVLGDDLRRAEYMVAIAGGEEAAFPLPAQSQGKLPPATMMRIFELREAMGQADEQAQKRARAEAGEWLAQVIAEITGLLDRGDTHLRTRELVGAARYLQKMLQS